MLPRGGFNARMSKTPQAYQTLAATLREIALLSSAAGVLHWDERTQLPPAGAELRGGQLGLLARMVHEQLTSPKIGDLLAQVETLDEARDAEIDVAVIVREVRRDYDRARKLPASLVEEMARTEVLSQSAWVEARKKSEYPMFEPWLGKMLELKRQEAQCIGYESTPYDALLDAYEPRETAAGIARVFEELRGPLVDLVGRITESSRKAPLEILERHYPAAKQEQLARDVASSIGYDFDAGRIDVSVHPFCTGLGPGDTRITTRYDEQFFGDAFFGTLHEVGHALYEQGLPKREHFGLPLAESVSLGIHESQSRLWENFVGRGPSFWRFYFPKVKQVFGDVLGDVSEERWVFAVNDVRPSFIRVESDEATYNLHIMLRFDLEQALLVGDLSTSDLPGAWNEKMRQYLGITPPDDARGCLQDIHWSGGAIGYFPTYTLGNLYAAQFFEQARKDLGDLDGQLSRGEFTPLLEWLREKIHRHGKRYTAGELVRRVTGSQLSGKPLMEHLTRKAAELYGV
jgi:carboxypeptidase Taq